MADQGKQGKRVIELKYSFTVAPGKGATSVWVPYPPDTAEQRVLKARITQSPSKAELRYDADWGNAMLYFSAPRTDKGYTFTIEYLIERSEVAVPASKKTSNDKADARVFEKYLRPSRMAVHNDRVRAFARGAAGSAVTVREKASGIYDFVLKNMEYSKNIPGWGRGDVNRVCLSVSGGEKGTGNCTDFHSFFASLSQVESIPVVFEMGFPLKAGISKPETVEGGYHCWARFYVEGEGWVPVDISEASKDASRKEYYFGSIDENRVLFSRGRDIVLTPPQKGEPLNYFGPDPYIELDGVPFKEFKRSITYL
ncbi:MAG: transglutaminase domain-containing protein [Deltaproteobacteria bacterium]|nr:transglutaminase domain-containing protein [Deltaproteobacteria bacterium]